MKAKKKRLGTKAKIRAEKERERRIATALFTALIVVIAILSAYFGYTYLNQPQEQTINPESTQPKAAIVDQLSLTFPNQTFMKTATKILEQAGYTVDYYPGEKVTVEFYRNLPTHGYKIIILRVHSTTGGYPTLVLFTSEIYSRQKYVYEQLTDQLYSCRYYYTDREAYFGILPPFVELSMKGKFQNTIIVVTGCEGLRNTKMAEAFIQKGAKVYIGWNALVSATHTDTATTILLQHLIIEKQTIRQAIENTMKEIGPDPTYKSILQYYPHSSAQQTIEKYNTSKHIIEFPEAYKKELSHNMFSRSRYQIGVEKFY